MNLSVETLLLYQSECCKEYETKWLCAMKRCVEEVQTSKCAVRVKVEDATEAAPTDFSLYRQPKPSYPDGRTIQDFATRAGILF